VKFWSLKVKQELLVKEDEEVVVVVVFEGVEAVEED